MKGLTFRKINLLISLLCIAVAVCLISIGFASAANLGECVDEGSTNQNALDAGKIGDDFYLTSTTEDFKIKLSKRGGAPGGVVMYYQIDNEGWLEYEFNSNLSVYKNQKIYFKNSGTTLSGVDG